MHEPRGHTDLRSFNNDWYQPGSALKRVLWYLVNLALLQNRWLPLSALKVAALRVFGARIGKGVIIKPGINVKYPWLLSIGDYSWIGEGVWIDNLAEVHIGAHCCLSQGAFLLCGNHDYSRSSFDLMVGKIHLEDGAWIGAKAIVGPNVTVGSHAVLSVQSVASSDLEAFGIYRGNPAQKVKERRISS